MTGIVRTQTHTSRVSVTIDDEDVRAGLQNTNGHEVILSLTAHSSESAEDADRRLLALVARLVEQAGDALTAEQKGDPSTPDAPKDGTDSMLAERLMAWVDDVQLSNQTGFPHYQKVAELKADIRSLVEQLEALRAAAEAMLSAERNPRDLQRELRAVLDALNPAIRPEMSEGVDVRPQGPPTGGNPSVGAAPSETSDPASEPKEDA